MKSFFLQAVFLISGTCAFSQIKPATDTVKPVQKAIVAGFDVIIKKNGEMLYGLVKEVGSDLIKYQRTDIPDGPLYTINKADVYAISYRNQVKDIINPLRDSVIHDTVVVHDAPVVDPNTAQKQQPDSVTKPKVAATKSNPFMDPKNLSAGNLSIGLGFLRSYSKVSQAGQYSSAVNFPVFSIAYDVRYNDQLRFGVQLAYGHHKFEGQQYSSYDSTKTAVTLNEYIFLANVYARYNFLYHTSRFQPYIIGGIGVHNSHINYQYNIAFINNGNDAVQVKSGNNSASLGFIGRIGADYVIDRGTKVFGDLGFGASVFNLGISLRID
jgi:hypothetical protein